MQVVICNLQTLKNLPKTNLLLYLWLLYIQMAPWIFLEIFYTSYLDELHDYVISSLLMTFQWYGWNWSNDEIKAQKLMFETKNIWLSIVTNLFMCLWVCVKPTKLSRLQPSMPTYLPLPLLQDIVLHAIDKLYLSPSLRSRLCTYLFQSLLQT